MTQKEKWITGGHAHIGAVREQNQPAVIAPPPGQPDLPMTDTWVRGGECRITTEHKAERGVDIQAPGTATGSGLESAAICTPVQRGECKRSGSQKSWTNLSFRRLRGETPQLLKTKSSRRKLAHEKAARSVELREAAAAGDAPRVKAILQSTKHLNVNAVDEVS